MSSAEIQCSELFLSKKQIGLAITKGIAEINSKIQSAPVDLPKYLFFRPKSVKTYM